MKTRIGVFNIYLAALVCTMFLACATSESKKKKELTSLSLHREVNPDGTGKNGPVAIRREEPRIYINIEKAPFLYEGDLIRAEVIDQMGGFAIRLQFDSRGVKILEAFSLSNRGKHFAVHCTFPQERWLAAPLFAGPIRDGSITFTPDTTREEAERIVLGLNNAVKKASKKFF